MWWGGISAALIVDADSLPGGEISVRAYLSLPGQPWLAICINLYFFSPTHKIHSVGLLRHAWISYCLPLLLNCVFTALLSILIALSRYFPVKFFGLFGRGTIRIALIGTLFNINLRIVVVTLHVRHLIFITTFIYHLSVLLLLSVGLPIQLLLEMLMLQIVDILDQLIYLLFPWIHNIWIYFIIIRNFIFTITPTVLFILF